MLTKEFLNANVEGLTEEQVARIATLSENDENRVIGGVRSDILSRFDDDIERISGIKKGENMKTWAYLKSTLDRLKESSGSDAKVQELNAEITTLKKERDDLSKKLKEGAGDDALKAEVSRLEQLVKDKETEIETVKTNLGDENTKLKADIETKTVENISGKLDSYLLDANVKFISTIPEEVLKETLTGRKERFVNSVKGRIDYVETAKGKQQVVRGEDGEIMYKKDNSPFSIGELYVKELTGLIDEGRTQTGTGTKPSGSGGGGGGTTLDMSAAKTQMQANDLIDDHLLKNEALTRGTTEFDDRVKELYEEHKVGDLPIR